jgi:diaminopimelate epimerase
LDHLSPIDFVKYHALGNDYLVFEPGSLLEIFSPQFVQRICDRHLGIGSDGILIGPIPSERADFGLRIFNPDGSEAEKSGNGLRIFARYLWDQGRLEIEKTNSEDLQSRCFRIETAGGIVQAQVFDNGKLISIDIGRAVFDMQPKENDDVSNPTLIETFQLEGKVLHFCSLSLGNPHCVVFYPEPTPDIARRFGPLLEKHCRFPNRTNVQFLKVLNRHQLLIEIWERGAGYTMSSGSSSCAAAAAAFKLGLCERQVVVQNPGGSLIVAISENLEIKLTGPAERVFYGSIEVP